MAVLAQINDRIVFPLNQTKTLIGRNPDNHICIDGQEVSGQHACIDQLLDGEHPVFYIEDLRSTNQTFVNGIAISRQQLQDDDEIRIGWMVLKFFDDTNPNYAKTSKIYKSWIPGVYYTK